MKLLLYIAGVACCLVPAAHAASFDCALAQRPVEKLICSDPRLNAADEQMGRRYRAGLQQLPPDAVGLLRADQVQWLAWLQETCQAPETRTAARPARAAACMLPGYVERTKQLSSIAVERDGVRFLLRTHYLAEPDEQVRQHPDWPAFGTLQAAWTVALSASPEWAAWNHAVEAAAYALAAEDVWSTGRQASPQPDWTPSLASRADTQVAVLVRRVEHGRVTSAVTRNTMGHPAAHPSETSRTMTWLLREERPLRPGDVFEPGDAWKKPVAEACWNAIRTGDRKAYVAKDVAGPDSAGLLAVIADPGNWTLEHDGLHVSYPEYSVSPRYAGMDDTVIPWSTLQPVLAEGFTAP